MNDTFLYLLPCQKDSLRLYERIAKIFELDVFPIVKLPFHVTLYYFPKPSKDTNLKIVEWLDMFWQKKEGPIVAEIDGLTNFKKDELDFVYYLALKTKKIIDLHLELRQTFSYIHADSFEFVPHLSLFYPQRNLKEKEQICLQQLFTDITFLTFDKISFATLKEGGTHYITTRNL